MVLWALPVGAEARTILVLGDSISSGYGLNTIDQGWVALLQQQALPLGIGVVNASIPGETTAGGLARIDRLLEEERPEVVVLELGANDGLRGLSPDRMKANLGEMIVRAKRAGAKVLVLGMKIPPNYGKRYTDRFEAVFPDLAREHGIAWIPFLLEGVGGEKDMMQTDGLHPNDAAQAVLSKRVWEALVPLLEKPAPGL